MTDNGNRLAAAGRATGVVMDVMGIASVAEDCSDL